MIVKPNNSCMVRSPIGYFGGKTKLRPTIISCIPDHDTYVEVFCWSGTVFFGKPPSKNEIINDVHSELVNLMKVISGTYFDSSIRQEFISYVRTMPASREAHKEWQKWDDIKLESLNPAQRAFIYYYCTKNGSPVSIVVTTYFSQKNHRSVKSTADWCSYLRYER